MGKVQCKNCGRMIRESDRRCLYCNMLNADYKPNTEPLIESSSLDETRRWDPAVLNNIEKSNVVNNENVKVVYTKNKNNSPAVKVIKIILAVVGSIFALILFNVIAEDIVFSIDYNTSPHTGYYLDGERLYYFDRLVLNDDGEWVDRWWVCDWNANKTACSWSIYEEGENLGFILDFNAKDNTWEYGIEEALNVHSDVFDIQLDKGYLDKGGLREPQTGYYYCNNIIYFYLKADWQIEEQYTGWYTYNESTQSWHFHSKYDFKGVLDELLYYYPDAYFVGESDASWRTTGIELPSSFLETEWYQTAQIIENQRR